MWDEADIRQERGWYYERIAKRCIAAFDKNNIDAFYVPDRDEALKKVLGMIPEGATIGIGDSVTLFQIGVIPALERRGRNQIFNPFLRDEEGKRLVRGRERLELQKRGLVADIFMCGSNAITLDGKLVNIDSRGNRVGGLIFGSEKVIVVAGVNKIVRNVEEALKRIKEMVAPTNAKRHNLKHGSGPLPCAITGICNDCRHPRRICCYTVIVEYQNSPLDVDDWGRRINVVLVGEELGI